MQNAQVPLQQFLDERFRRLEELFTERFGTLMDQHRETKATLDQITREMTGLDKRVSHLEAQAEEAARMVKEARASRRQLAYILIPLALYAAAGVAGLLLRLLGILS